MKRPTLEQWLRERQRNEEPIPWAGPRPLKRGDHLVGRGAKIQEFVETLDFTPLVVLSAASGAGKSSLLDAGLVPRLSKRRRVPIVCSKWSRPGTTNEDFERFLHHHAIAYLGAEGERELADQATHHTSASTPFTSFVKAHIPRSAVVVLDQFEELIRLNRPAADQVLAWVHEATSKHHIRVVISLRVEYLHELRDLERQMAPRAVRHIDLEPITEVALVHEIVDLGRKGEPVAEVTDGLRTAIEAAWTRQGAAPTSGLLGLQALLYSLYWTMLDNGKSTIDEEVFAPFLPPATDEVAAASDGEGPAAPPGDSSPFDAALPSAAKMKIESCVAALRALSHDSYLEAGTLEKIREATRHLNSGGFKLHREVWELARTCLDRELELLGHDVKTSRQTFVRVAELTGTLDGSRAGEASGESDIDLLATASLVLASRVLGRDLEGGHPWELDAHEVTSGPLQGLSRDHVLVEECRRFLFALKWLEESSLVRITSAAAQDEWVVSLIHDGFGKALADWADDFEHSPRVELSRLTGSRGQTFRWTRRPGDAAHQTDESPWPELDGATVVNARWRDCEVPGLFVRRTRFVNCDFRGTRFKDCRFEGAVFVNCLLDGVTFAECEIVGPAGAYPVYHGQDAGTPDLQLAPSFEIPIDNAVQGDRGDGSVGALDASALETLRWYRGDSGSTDRLISHTSGMPAVPMTGAHTPLFASVTRVGEHPDDSAVPIGRPWRGPLPPPQGGLSMLGGRLSSLMLRRTKFVADAHGREGEVALRLVTGTALDVVEHSTGKLRLTLTGSAIRGLTVTGHHGTDEIADVEINVDDCLLTETWFGEGLHGTATISVSRVWHLTNLSWPNATPPDPESEGDPEQTRRMLAVSIANSRYAHLANVRVPGAGSHGGDRPPPFDVDDESPVDKIDGVLSEVDRATTASLASRMDYQSSPAQAEYERREEYERVTGIDTPMTWPAFDPRPQEDSTSVGPRPSAATTA